MNHTIEIEAGLRALVRTLAPAGGLTGGRARLVAAIQNHFGTYYQLSDLEPISDHALAAYLVDPWLRQQLVRALVIGLLIDGTATYAELARIEAVAACLGVDEPAITDAAYFMAGKKWRLRRRVISRFWALEHVRARVAKRGFLRTVIPVIGATIFGWYRNKELARKFATLRAYPPGSLGRGYIDYLERNHYPLPGERGATSDIIVPHDLAHVLGGYSTAPSDEVLVASFSAGHRAKDGFAMVMFVLFQFHLGLRITPGAKAERGLFDPATVIEAIARGAAATADLTAVDWQFWDDFAAPIEELRRRYHVAPRARESLGYHGCQNANAPTAVPPRTSQAELIR